MAAMAEGADPFAGVRARFRERLIQDRSQLSAAAMWPTCEDHVAATVHRIAGLAGTLGYPDLSDAAKSLEDRLHGGAAAAPEIEAARTKLLEGVDVVIGGGSRS